VPTDITNETEITLDGRTIPVQLIRALGETTGRLRIERDDASVEEIEVERDGDAFHFRRTALSRSGSDQNPVDTEYRAELVSPDNRRRKWVTCGSQEHIDLLVDGWEEKGRTRPRAQPTQSGIQSQVDERKKGG